MHIKKARNHRHFCGRMVGLGGGEKRRRKKVEKIEGRRLEKPLGAAAEFNFFFFFFFCLRGRAQGLKDTCKWTQKAERGGSKRLVGG